MSKKLLVLASLALIFSAVMATRMLVNSDFAAKFGLRMPDNAAESSPSPTLECQTDIEGQMVHVPVGQGIQAMGIWRICELYEGHGVIVYSGKPPRVSTPLTSK